jgi:hypothetical protein
MNMFISSYSYVCTYVCIKVLKSCILLCIMFSCVFIKYEKNSFKLIQSIQNLKDIRTGLFLSPENIQKCCIREIVSGFIVKISKHTNCSDRH